MSDKQIKNAFKLGMQACKLKDWLPALNYSLKLFSYYSENELSRSFLNEISHEFKKLYGPKNVMMNFEGLSQLKAEFWLNLVRVLKQNNKESDAKSILIQTKLLDLFDKNFYQLELELKNTDSSEKYVILNDLDLS